jgi:hypothetical protein
MDGLGKFLGSQKSLINFVPTGLMTENDRNS